jgi:hypothetical protein
MSMVASGKAALVTFRFLRPEIDAGRHLKRRLAAATEF